MRLNKFIAQASGLSRRAADTAIADGRVSVNYTSPTVGQDVSTSDIVQLDQQVMTLPVATQTIMLNKPVGYVVSRNGQGSRTVYDLLPSELQHLKPIGRLDKDSSGLLLLTNDGDLANRLTHPSQQKRKLYQVTLHKPLQPLHQQIIADRGVSLEDGVSKFGLQRLRDGDDTAWIVSMHEGRNRQIRRTFAALGYDVQRLQRTDFGSYRLDKLPSGQWQAVKNVDV